MQPEYMAGAKYERIDPRRGPEAIWWSSTAPSGRYALCVVRDENIRFTLTASGIVGGERVFQGAGNFGASWMSCTASSEAFVGEVDVP
jgi:hypothetical protein